MYVYGFGTKTLVSIQDYLQGKMDNNKTRPAQS